MECWKYNIGKFDARSDEGIFLGYSKPSISYRNFNNRTLSIEESIHVEFDDSSKSIEIRSSTDEEDNQIMISTQKELNSLEELTAEETPIKPINETVPNEWKSEPNYTKKFIIGDLNEGMKTRASRRNEAKVALISQLEPKKINQAFTNKHWVKVIKEELDQFDKNQVTKTTEKAPVGSSEKKFKFDFNSTLTKRVVDLDLLSSLDCPIKPFYEFQGWANIFFIPMEVYEPRIRLFYANLRSPKAREIEYLAKHELVVDPSDPLPSHLGRKNLSFETGVIAHIIATTLLPRARSHSTLSLCDTLLTYCIVSRVIIHLPSFILSAMDDVISEPSTLPFAFFSMGYTRTISSSALKNDLDDVVVKSIKSKPSSSTAISSPKLNAALEKLSDMDANLDALTIYVTRESDLVSSVTAMKEQVDSLKDLLLSAHVKINVVKDVTKETAADVARIRLRFDQIVKEAIKIATKVQASAKSISTSLTSRFKDVMTREYPLEVTQ
ncbi:hypothetical protein KY284_024845 [Solanum tuberosum]|nr:hypothetical protein KY284_024845 [Solanum tuberosum]